MVKKITVVILSLIMLLSTITVQASTTVNDAMANLAMQAQHYYNTKVAYADMTIYRPNEKNYWIYHTADNGKVVSTQLYKTDWGTWNLGDMNISDGYSQKTVIGGATDWEYVFRVYNPITQTLEFTGGNHGSEELKELNFRDGITGESFTLAVGESRYVSRLIVEEKTSIKIGNIDYLPYADVQRTYTIVGDTVNLDCNITFVRDMKMALSYSSMACVNKDFSRYCIFDNEAYVITGEKGTVTNKYLGNMPASVCYLSGDDPSATVTVGIYNAHDMTDDFSNKEKTFLWDMSEDFNKLYFSKYDMSNLTKITAGTTWKFGSFWTVNVN